jgi:hypothetical protein
MYKHKTKTRLENLNAPIHWAKRKIMLIITAFMIGMSNGMNVGDHTINGNQITRNKYKRLI